MTYLYHTMFVVVSTLSAAIQEGPEPDFSLRNAFYTGVILTLTVLMILILIVLLRCFGGDIYRSSSGYSPLSGFFWMLALCAFFVSIVFCIVDLVNLYRADVNSTVDYVSVCIYLGYKLFLCISGFVFMVISVLLGRHALNSDITPEQQDPEQ